MKNSVGVIFRVISFIAFLLGILICIFSFKTGIIMIILGVIGWNVGGKLIGVYSAKSNENDIEVGVKTSTKPISYQYIDYSAIPYDLSLGWESSDNRFQALTDITYMNEFLKETQRLGNIKQKLEICTEEVLWEGMEPSTLSKIPHTKTGKVPKYPVEFFFTTRDSTDFEPPDHYFGHIYYMQDGSIGKAWLMCWIKKTGYRVDIGLAGTSLIVKKVEKYTPQSGGGEVIYKWK